MTKRIAVIPCGGCKGIIQARILKALQSKNGDLDEFFDLIVGSSVGAILGSFIARRISFNVVDDVMPDILKSIFKKKIKIPLLSPDYDRSIFSDQIKEFIHPCDRMCLSRTKLIVTSINRETNRTHFFKSWQVKDGELSIVQCLLRSFAAPKYFGQLVDSDGVWIDGGAGLHNLPLDVAYTEAVTQKWLNEEIEFHIIGNGYTNQIRSKKDISSDGQIKQLLDFFRFTDGGLARSQSYQDQIRKLTALQKSYPNIKLFVYDQQISKDLDVLDGVKFVKAYQDIGDNIVRNSL
jgi:hypothetical protein